MDHFLLLALGGLIAGAMNALAGGGSFVSLPVMIAAGVPSVQANASGTVALSPGRSPVPGPIGTACVQSAVYREEILSPSALSGGLSAVCCSCGLRRAPSTLSCRG